MQKRSSKSTPVQDQLPPLPLAVDLWQNIANQLALAPQQVRIVELILRGLQDKEIVTTLGLSLPTVRTYLSRIFDRVGVSDRIGLVLRIFALAQEIATQQCHQD